MTCARLADEKKASGIVVLDLRKLNSITDYFVVCSSANERQSRAIADEVIVNLKRQGVPCLHQEGERTGPWILADFGDVVLHVFRDSHRQHYDLETLWGDAPVVPWAPKARAKRKTGATKRKAAAE